MIPAKVLYNRLAGLMAADAGMAIGAQIAVIIAPFVGTTNSVLSDLTLGVDDLDPKTTTAAPVTGLDPATLQWEIIIPEIVGGFRWTLAGATPLLPITIYGFALTNGAATDLLATYTLDLPLIITAPGTVLTFHQANFLMLAPPLL